MATNLSISLSEYLNTSYKPDREYLDGELRERHVGRWEHARTLALLAAWFAKHENRWGIKGGITQRLQVSTDRIRVPDLVVMTAGPQPDVLVDPPLLVIEILSPDDSYSDTQERANDYRQMGVETIWIIDPKTRTGRVCTGAQWIEATRLEVRNTPLFVELANIFRQIDPVS